MGFNEAQTQAIQHTDGPCLVLAGPGSGKTLTIVNRVKYLIEKQKVRPEEILVVTFTRFAAAEMKSRLCLVMGKRDLPVTVGTFHGIYYGILKWAYRMNQENILSGEIVFRPDSQVSKEGLAFSKVIIKETADVEEYFKNLIRFEGYRIISEKADSENFRAGYDELCMQANKLLFMKSE